jgi:tetratricopeptide (TPR) repeat protein
MLTLNSVSINLPLKTMMLQEASNRILTCSIAYLRGHAYSELGQYQHVIEDYNEAIRLKPDLVEAHKNLGNAFYCLIKKNWLEKENTS